MTSWRDTEHKADGQRRYPISGTLPTLLGFLRTEGTFAGTISQLHAALMTRVPLDRKADYPPTPQGLGGVVNGCRQELARYGWRTDPTWLRSETQFRFVKCTPLTPRQQLEKQLGFKLRQRD